MEFVDWLLQRAKFHIWSSKKMKMLIPLLTVVSHRRPNPDSVCDQDDDDDKIELYHWWVGSDDAHQQHKNQ